MNEPSSQLSVVSFQKTRDWRDGRPRPWKSAAPTRTGEDARLSTGSRSSFFRWLKFNFVGGIGIGVQLAALAVFRSVLHLDYLVATALAVETAVLHNFLWHQRFTWADRGSAGPARSLLRLAKFNASNGAVSVVGNLLLMRVLVGEFGVNYVMANLVAITGCSIVNFLLSDRFVFDREPEAGNLTRVPR